MSELERQIAGDRVGREEAVARLQAQLSEQEAAVREERHLVRLLLSEDDRGLSLTRYRSQSTMELAELREKAKETAAANEVRHPCDSRDDAPTLALTISLFHSSRKPLSFGPS